MPFPGDVMAGNTKQILWCQCESLYGKSKTQRRRHKVHYRQTKHAVSNDYTTQATQADGRLI